MKRAVFALLGSNGSGKTTIVKILTTLLKQDSGTATVNGFDVLSKPDNVRQSISLTGQFAAVDGAAVIAYPIHFLPLISSAFVPTKSMPGPVRAFAENQPVTLIVETIRALLSNQPVGTEIWVALTWCSGIILVAYLAAMRVYKRRM